MYLCFLFSDCFSFCANILHSRTFFCCMSPLEICHVALFRDRTWKCWSRSFLPKPWRAIQKTVKVSTGMLHLILPVRACRPPWAARSAADSCGKTSAQWKRTRANSTPCSSDWMSRRKSCWRRESRSSTSSALVCDCSECGAQIGFTVRSPSSWHWNPFYDQLFVLLFILSLLFWRTSSFMFFRNTLDCFLHGR